MIPPRAFRTRSALLVYAAFTGAVALTTALMLPVDNVGHAIDHFWWIALASGVAVGSLVAVSGLWTATGSYAVVFWCFHFGLIAGLGSGLVAPSDISLWDQSWVLGPFATDAAVLALTGCLALASGGTLIRACHPYDSPTAMAGRQQAAHPHGVAGSILVLATIATWCGIVLAAGGAGGFFVSYLEYLEMTADYSEVMSIVWLALGCGFVMSVTGGPGWLRTSAIVAFVCQALLSLLLGLRGEILFSCTAAVVALARSGRGPSPRAVCTLGLALLVLIPVVRVVRSAGARDLSQVVWEIRPFDAFTEMGGSLHPVEKVVRWRAEGEPLEQGGSYWAPIERAAQRLLPGTRAVAAEDDRRIMNVLVVERVGAIGFSPVAEAYRNFGAVGVALAFAVLGGILACLDVLSDRRTAVLALATVYLPLLINVRNSFISVPAQCAAGILVVLVLTLMRHVVESVMCRPYARVPDIRSAV